MHKVNLEENPGLFKLIDDSVEESCRHLYKVSFFWEAALLVNNFHISRHYVVVDKHGDFSAEIQLALDIYLAFRLFVHLSVAENVLDLSICCAIVLIWKLVWLIWVKFGVIIFVININVGVSIGSELSVPLSFVFASFPATSCLYHQHSALAELFQMLKKSVRERDNVTQELRRMLWGSVHLKRKKANSNDIIAENKRTQNVGVLAIFLWWIIRTRAACHELQNVQNLVK